MPSVTPGTWPCGVIALIKLQQLVIIVIGQVDVVNIERSDRI
jgi:hypothetical protein